MPTRIKLGRQRRVIARLIMDLLQIPTQSHLGSSNYGSRCDDIILMCAITIGQVDRRPMTAAKLADYAGMPRPTVVRKLKEFERRGMIQMVGGIPIGVPEHMNGGEIEKAVETISRAIHKASVELSKMDSKAIANKEPPK